MNKDKLEFYSENRLIATVNSSIVPEVGSFISIRRKTWHILNVNYALDHAAVVPQKRMRANIEIEPV